VTDTARASTFGEDIRCSAVADRLNSAALRLVRRVRREDRSLGETPARLSIISTLVNRGPTTPTDLAELEQVRPPTVTRLVQALERDGYVIRRTARHDARVSMIVATSKAWKLLEDIRERRLGALRSGLGRLEPDELRTLEDATALIERLAMD
jgi:DNA-binding MarR family transcriptional regulator